MRSLLWHLACLLSLLLAVAITALWVASYRDSYGCLRIDQSDPENTRIYRLTFVHGKVLLTRHQFFGHYRAAAGLKFGRWDPAQMQKKARDGLNGSQNFGWDYQGWWLQTGESRSLNNWVWAAVFPCWTPTVLLLVAPTIRLSASRLRRARARRGHCPTCGYDLRASKDQCPECGRAITAKAPDL